MPLPQEGAPPDLALADSVTIDHVRDAAARLAGVAHPTPVLTSSQTDRRLGGKVGAARAFLKCECFQRVGAFKFRGAYNALSKLPTDQKRAGALTFSSGNHAQAIALAARLLGVRAVIVMPNDAPALKLDATRGYLEGTAGEVVLYDRDVTVREELGADLADKQGLTIVPPYDHPDVIAGQGTTALELFEQVEALGPPRETTSKGSEPGTLDRLYVCCGGGGLLSGCATVAKAVDPSCQVIGVEPAAADDAVRSFRTGRLQTAPNPDTIADGARTISLGAYTFAVVMQRVDEMLSVSESEIARAMLWAHERLKIVVEPAGALALAGAFQDADSRPNLVCNARVGVIISGGNVDPQAWAHLIALAERAGAESG